MCKLHSFWQRYKVFVNSENRMKIKVLIILTFCCLFCWRYTHAVPVRFEQSTYVQPDGTTFTANIRGDEWTKIRTLTDGCAIIKEKDGWWCYGKYDSEGYLTSTGYRVGNDVPFEVLNASRQIPYSTLAEKANLRRSHSSEYSSDRLKAIREQSAITKAGGKTQIKCLIILAEFKDCRFKFSKSDFVNMLCNQTNSAKRYYESQFGDGWEFTLDISTPVTLSRNSSYYGENDNNGDDKRAHEMIIEACTLADAEIDFSQYDQDGNGQVDNVFVFYAGYDESELTSEPDLIWAHQWYILDGAGITFKSDEGKIINMYACSSELNLDDEISGIGTFCHEFGHTFGLKDLYDTDYDQAGGWAAGTWGKTSLMDAGNGNNDSKTPPHFNCIEREILGLSTPILLRPGLSYTLEPIHKHGTYYKLNTDTEGEYYLFECRSNEDWDKYIGGKGMLVYHVDKSSEYDVKWFNNTVNANVNHQCADLIEADRRSDRIYSFRDYKTDISGIFFPQPGVTSIEADGSKPSLTYWNGNSGGISIAGITLTDNVIEFKVISGNAVPTPPTARNVTYKTFPDAAIIYFTSSDPTLEGRPKVKWFISGNQTQLKESNAIEYEKGKYVCKLTGLESGNTPYQIQMVFENEGIAGTPCGLSIMTKKTPPVIWPYIYISGEEISGSAGIHLHVVNANNAEQIQWQYNDTDISPDKDLYFRPEGSGTLKAIVTWKDGSQDIIIKKIDVK